MVFKLRGPISNSRCGSKTFFEAVVEQFDVFTRSDLGDEIVLDTVGWDPEEKPGSCHE